MEEQAVGVLVGQSLHIRVLVLGCIYRSDGNEESPDAVFKLIFPFSVVESCGFILK